MECKNPYCKGTQFIPVFELDTNCLIGVKCRNCGARYTIKELEIISSLERTGWNSVIWNLEHIQ